MQTTHVHLTAHATIEVREAEGEPYLRIDPDGELTNVLYVYLGNGYGDRKADQLHHHLDMLLTAADAAIRMAERAAEPAAGAELVEVPAERCGEPYSGYRELDPWECDEPAGHPGPHVDRTTDAPATYEWAQASLAGALRPASPRVGPDDDDDEDDDQVDSGEASAAAHGSTSRYLIQPAEDRPGRWSVWDDQAGVTRLSAGTIAQAVAEVRDLTAQDNLEAQATDPQAERVAVLARQAAAVDAVRYDVAHPLTEAEARAVWGNR